MKMKKYIYPVCLAMGLTAASCSLDEFPQASITPETFFKTENDLRLYTNSFYNAFPGASTFYTENVDITTGREIPEIVRGAYVIPTTGGLEPVTQYQFLLGTLAAMRRRDGPQPLGCRG